MSTALRNELQKIHSDISKKLGLSPEYLQFDYHPSDERIRLHLITRNPRHEQAFLFHTSEGFSEIDAALRMLDYVTSHQPSKHSYTIQWSLRDSSNLHTSYFRGQNVYEVLDKFYFGKDIHSTIIFHISLNPLA